MIEVILGPMRSGKTYFLSQEINSHPDYLGVELAYNTRGTERELSKLAPCVTDWTPDKDLPHHWCGKQVSRYLIDEIHFFEVFGDLKKFLEFMATYMINYDLTLSGLFADCYSQYRPFKIWSFILPLATKITVLDSREKCARCGEDKKLACLSAPVENAPVECVGDHYENICWKCVNLKR